MIDVATTATAWVTELDARRRLERGVVEYIAELETAEVMRQSGANNMYP